MENNILLNQLKVFYENKKLAENTNLITLFKILNHNNMFKKSKEKKISLRLIDWFVTNYCKKTNVIMSNNNQLFNVHLSYKNELKSYSKKQFDPFRRDERITLVFDDNKKIETTSGQLNFFRWLIKNNIIIYIRNAVDF